MTEFYNKLFKIFTSLVPFSKKYIRKNFGITYSNLSLVFLCGGNTKEYNSRDELSRIIKKDSKNQIIISEKLIDLTCGLDLLSFERVLEAVSKAIIIPVESIGTACELGAFTYSTSSPKEIVIVNNKYSEPGSFIIDGPVALLKKNSKDSILYADYLEDEKTLVVNNDIAKINTLNLMKKEIRLHKYYDYDKTGEKLIIQDLGTFLFCVLDLCYFIGYCNSKIIIKYFCTMHDKKRLCLNSVGFDYDEKNVSKVIESFLSIMTKIKVLKKKDDFWYPNLKSCFDKSKVGSLLFSKTFLESDQYANFYIAFRNLKKIL